MKQPTPHGGSLGIDCMIFIKRDGLPAQIGWRLYEEDEVIAEGVTGPDGKSLGVPVAMYYYGTRRYGFEMVAQTGAEEVLPT